MASSLLAILMSRHVKQLLTIVSSKERDDKDAIDESNVIDERTRGAKPTGTYKEPGDEEGLPTDDGTSST